jgi:2-oxoglutarate ferredoxin oxidoreductase subunit alpha
MTPSSSVLTNLASWQDKTGMIVRHSEDEIAVINTALGSAFAGMRSAVGTSGGGFALMVEAISLAGITETPVVIFLAQRPGPATGMPTWMNRVISFFTIFSGHGEFPKIVLAPGDVEEMLKIAAEAYNLADIYQTPVIILSEMFLSESHQSLAKKTVMEFWQKYQLKRGKLVDKPTTASYKRYQITQDGISPRLIPGVQGYYYQANSYEHLEDGHTTEIGEERKKQVDKRNAKILAYLKQDFCLPKIYGDFSQAELVLVGWGGTKGVLLESQRILTEKNMPTALIHFTYLYPLDGEKLRPLLTAKKNYLLVENNSTAQLGKLLKMEVGVEIKNKLLKYDGRMFFPEEIVNFAEKKYDS